MVIAIGSDHAGYELKEKIKKYLDKNEIAYKDFGTYSRESCDYPIFAKQVASAVVQNPDSKGILICGTGIGISIAANKIKGTRAALCYDPNLAILARKHNNANVLCLGGRVTDFLTVQRIVDRFLGTPFEGGRHQKRIEEIENT